MLLLVADGVFAWLVASLEVDMKERREIEREGGRTS